MINRIGTAKRMSQAVVHGNVVYLAGQVAADTSGDVRQQTAQVLNTIDRLLTEAGSSRAVILQAQIWLANMEDFQAMNDVWDEWVPQGHAPARATVQANLARPDFLIEIAVVAAIDGQTL